jgi:leader peptidase (prepilin peptidase)/N-methyltransferase
MLANLPMSIIAFVFGACIGSFLNVCIYRIPVGLSIVHPGSSCPRCRKTIPFYDNIPILSYLLLMGKCRACQAPIALRYPFIELLGGGFALASVHAFGMTLNGVVIFIFIATLIVVTFIDLDHRIIPDVISLPGIPIFFLASWGVPTVSWQSSAIGILIGGGSLFAVAWIYQLITGREGMGGGDIKLLAMIGAMIGWQGIVFTIFAASAIGTVIGILAMCRSGKGMRLAIPFGPFLSLGAVIYIFFGDRLIFWYLQILG